MGMWDGKQKKHFSGHRWRAAQANMEAALLGLHHLWWPESKHLGLEAESGSGLGARPKWVGEQASEGVQPAVRLVHGGFGGQKDLVI